MFSTALLVSRHWLVPLTGFVGGTRYRRPYRFRIWFLRLTVARPSSCSLWCLPINTLSGYSVTLILSWWFPEQSFQSAYLISSPKTQLSGQEENLQIPCSIPFSAGVLGHHISNRSEIDSIYFSKNMNWTVRLQRGFWLSSAESNFCSSWRKSNLEIALLDGCLTQQEKEGGKNLRL